MRSLYEKRARPRFQNQTALKLNCERFMDNTQYNPNLVTNYPWILTGNPGTCPSCGYCPHCGRQNIQPSYPGSFGPTWSCTSATSGYIQPIS